MLRAAHRSVGVFVPSRRAYAKDCGKKKQRFSLLQHRLPGAGMHPDSLTPFDVVLKDGFMYVECVRDLLFEKGDKFGNNRLSYTLGDVANVSIVHYNDLVASEDREPMTHEVCFEFCRTLPKMNFFSVTQGRDCYCAPYYKMISGDTSDCDAPCEGDSGSFCGGMSKSAVFSMHWCADTAMELSAASEKAKALEKNATDVGKDAETLAKNMEKAAVKLQKAFGAVGDAVASNSMQATKFSAGKLLHAAEDVLDLSAALKADVESAKGMEKDDFSDEKKVKAGEAVLSRLDKGISETTAEFKKLNDLYKLATRGKGDKGREAEYVPLMYFVNKKFEASPTTCGGDADKASIFAESKGECAAACDAQVNNPACVGFAFYDGGVCILFSKLKSATYYTGCDDTTKNSTSCFAKFANFEGTSLKPDPSGECKVCLKEATEAKRCF